MGYVTANIFVNFFSVYYNARSQTNENDNNKPESCFYGYSQLQLLFWTTLDGLSIIIIIMRGKWVRLTLPRNVMNDGRDQLVRGKLCTHNYIQWSVTIGIATEVSGVNTPEGRSGISDVSFLSGISVLSVWSHVTISPLLFFCLVLSLFRSDSFLLLAHSHDLLFPKPPFSER